MTKEELIATMNKILYQKIEEYVLGECELEQMIDNICDKWNQLIKEHLIRVLEEKENEG